MSVSLITIGCLLIAVLGVVEATHLDCASEFKKFKQQFNRHYKGPAEAAKAEAVFCRKLHDAERRNRADAQHGGERRAFFSAFTELGDVELPRGRPLRVEPRSSGTFATEYAMPATTPQPFPGAKNWSKGGGGGPVWNQGQCGSSWAFPVADNIAIQEFWAGKPWVPLSVQEIVSCDTTDDGCNGGLPQNALQYIIDSLGGTLLTNESFPYNSGSGQVPACQTTGTVGAYIKGFVTVNGSEATMTNFVAFNATIATAIDAEPLQTYIGGILSGAENCGQQEVDHGILLVGYDDWSTPPYWILKNSWGTSWGEQGYVRIEKGVNCLGIANQVGVSAVLGTGPLPTPPPTPPVPTTPPPPPPPQIQRQDYGDAQCNNPGQVTNFLQNQCVTTWESTSVLMFCNPANTQISLTSYLTSDCTGTSVSEVFDAGTCLADGMGMSLSYTCIA